MTNTSGASATADVFLDFQAERHAIEPLVFAPHETKVLSVIELLGNLKVSPAEAPEGGITIVPRGPTPMLVAQGRITDPVTGFSTTLNFLDPSLQLASALHASGLPIGLPSKGSPFAGMGTFTPHVIVRNLLGSPQTATVTVEYPTDEGPARTALAPLALAAYETRDFSLDAVMGQLPLPLAYASIRIEYSGAPGSTIAEVASIEAKGDLVVDGRLANEGDGWAGSGGNPWHLDEETDSVLFLTNMSDQDCLIGFRLDGQSKPYFLTGVKLKPHETRAIDIRQLRDAQKPDFQGSVLPAGATDGTVLWNRIEHVPVMGQMVVLQRNRGTASPYACFLCSCGLSFDWLDVSPVSVNLLPTGTAQDAATARHHDCNGTPFFYTVTGGSTWGSTNTPVATVNNTTYKGRVTGVAGGTAGIWASYTGYVVDTAWSPDWGANCHTYPQTSSNTKPANVTVASQSPSEFNMSTGDTKTITLSVTPSTVAVNTSFTGKSPPTSNPDSSCAASLTIPGKSNVSGSVSHNVTASSAGCSGVFNSVRGSATPTAGGGTANNSTTTTVRVPPQILIQMLNAEAGGQTGPGDMSQPSIGVVARNRFGNPDFPGSMNYQNTIPGQFAVNPLLTTGKSPELDNSAGIYTRQTGDIVGGTVCFWSPTAVQWATVQQALQSGTTAFPQDIGSPACYPQSQRQIVHKTSVSLTTRPAPYAGAPAFLFIRSRVTTSPAAVQIP